VWSIAADHEAAMTRLVAGDADFIEMVRPNKFGEVSRDSNLALTPYPSLDIGFLHFNLRDPRAPRARHPVLGERGVRRALAMAIDGDALARAIFDSLGIKARGPFTRALATSDTTIAQLPFDPAGSRALLDSLGWRDRDRNGVREKNGRPLRFAIVSPSISTARTRAGVLIQDMLKAVGVSVDLQQMDINPWLELLRSGSFDAALNGIHYDPSPATIRMSWTGQAARSGDGTNYGGYINPVFDRVVDSAVNEMDAERSRELYRRAYEILINDAPAVWLYETVNYSAHHARLKPVNLRADAWWASIAEWKIPPGERLPRDRAREAVAQR
jgi:peptide/nickel transport system substrate-binding protein